MLGTAKTDEIVADFSRRIFMTGGQLEISEAAMGYPVTQRRLQQLFAIQLGISPVLFKRLVRFRHTLRIFNAAKAATNSKLSLTQLCYLSGYYDQSHFIRDFKCFSGIMPRQYLKGNFRLNEIVTDTE
jgi:AraC-like DNA-binding protein